VKPPNGTWRIGESGTEVAFIPSPLFHENCALEKLIFEGWYPDGTHLFAVCFWNWFPFTPFSLTFHSKFIILSFDLHTSRADCTKQDKIESRVRKEQKMQKNQKKKNEVDSHQGQQPKLVSNKKTIVFGLWTCFGNCCDYRMQQGSKTCHPRCVGS
jgi:hypothetical protein